MKHTYLKESRSVASAKAVRGTVPGNLATAKRPVETRGVWNRVRERERIVR